MTGFPPPHGYDYPNPPGDGGGTGLPFAVKLSPGDRLPLLAAVAACVGIVIGCTGPWVDVAVFSIGGLDAGPWGKVWIGVAALSAIILAVLLSTERLQIDPQIALTMIWGVFVAAVACAAFSVPYVIRIVTLPKAEFFGLRMGAQVGWGLWLLVVSAGVLVGAAAVAAGRVGRACDVIARSWDPLGSRGTLPRNPHREVAVGLAVAVTLAWAGYYWGTWNGGLPGSDNVASERRSGSEWPFGEQRDRESSSSAPTSTAAAGEEIQLGGLQLEVPGIWLQRVIGTGRSPLSTHEPRGIWVVAPIKVTNTSSEKQRFDTTGQELVVDGKSYSGNTFAANDVASDASSSISLNPGLSGYVVAVFDVPAGIFPASEAALNLQSDFGGPHVLVAVDTSPELQSSSSGPTTRSPAPSSTRRPTPSTSSKPAAVPPRTSPDLGLNVPLSRPSCDGTGIVVLGSAFTPAKYREEVARMLSLNPGASYLRTDLACPSLRQDVNGNPIYAVYRVAGTTRAQVCAAVAAAGKGTYGKWLDSDSDPADSIDCDN